MTTAAPYVAPRSLEEALALLAQGGGEAAPLAGGTDLWPLWSSGRRTPPPLLVDLKRIEGLDRIEIAPDAVTLGACVRLADLARDPRLARAAPPLAEAAGRIACPQVRNRATLGGNLANASPAADTAPALLVLDAEVEIASLREGKARRRTLPLAEFFRGPGETALEPGEILAAVRFPPFPPPGSTGSAFAAWDKFGTRPAMEIAVASAAAALVLEDGVVARARVAYGSVAPVPLRGRAAEAALEGRALDPEAVAACVEAARREAAPIDDVRAGAGYRREILGVLLQRMLRHAGGD